MLLNVTFLWFKAYPFFITELYYFTSYSAKKSQFADEPSQSAFGPAPTTKVTLPSSYSDEHSSTDQFFSNYEPVPFSASLNESSPTGITDRSDQGMVCFNKARDLVQWFLSLSKMHLSSNLLYFRTYMIFCIFVPDSGF